MPSQPATATRPFGGGGKWPRRRRLLRRADFRAAYERGLRRASRHFTVFARCQPGGQAADTRFGITATRQLGPAVVRNRIRRRTRALLRRVGGALPPGYDVVINPRRTAAAAGFADLEQELANELRRLGESLERRRARPEGEGRGEG